MSGYTDQLTRELLALVAEHTDDQPRLRRWLAEAFEVGYTAGHDDHDDHDRTYGDRVNPFGPTS
jgi:hypothetical protein